MTPPSIGVANSVSANFDFDPLDTIKYAAQEGFETVQIYLNEKLLNDGKVLSRIRSQLAKFKRVYFHAEGFFNKNFPEGNYYESLLLFLQHVENANYILHFDEAINIEKLFDLTDKLASQGIRIFVENYFQKSKKENAEKNIKKFTALFTLANTVENVIFPVLDIPRIFHKKLGFKKAEALRWTYQLLNFFGNKNIPILLHLIDCNDPSQSRHSYCAVGEGYIPYSEIFEFVKKTKPPISDIILEFEDKINPVTSRKFIQEQLLEV
jgi:hypothetical protein